MTNHRFLAADAVRDLVAGPAGEHCPFLPVFGAPAVMFVRGEGTQLWDSAGKRYLDFLSGIAVTSLGHAHPGVARAIAEQVQRLADLSYGAEKAADDAAAWVAATCGFDLSTGSLLSGGSLVTPDVTVPVTVPGTVPGDTTSGG